ncbi:UNVERIFIED_CONTAM: LuxR family transcriptional regulator, partial [Salmonella enterica subsp. enterica serovar Weltevreden]
VRRSLSLPPTQSDELANYLSSSVLSLQEAGVRDFLLRTSVLTRLSGPLCQAVTGRADAEQILLELERSGLFLRRLGTDTEWFRYHTLFSEFLAKQLRRLPATI